MSEVKRYEDEIYGPSNYDFEESENGTWVKYEDHFKMVSAIKEEFKSQPVKLPPRRSMLTREDIDQDYVTCMAISVEDAVAAIRAAGYEVIE